MSLDDIRNRYKPKVADQSELVKRLQAENAQQKRDILELLGRIEQLETGRPPGPQVDETEAIEEQLKAEGLTHHVLRGTVTLPRESENVAGNGGGPAEIAAAHALRTTQSGIALETSVFTEPYRGNK